MTPAEKLRDIVARGKGDDLERAEKEFAHLNQSQLKRYGGPSGSCFGKLEKYRQERHEWEAANTLLEALLKEAN